MTPKRRTKIERLCDEFELTELGDELVEKWTRENPESLRSLAEYVNVRVLRVTMDQAGITTIDGDPTHIYDALNADTASSVNRIKIRKQLEREGIDIDELQSNFVTYQAVRSYLKNVRDVDQPTKSDQQFVADEIDTIQRLLSRSSAVTERKLDNLDTTNRIELGDFRLLVDFQVYCQDCEIQQNVVELLETGGCDCQ